MVTEQNIEYKIQIFKELVPENAIALRSAASQIISSWIKSGRPYPNNILDGFVYIESDIADSIEDSMASPISFQIEMERAYDFHLKRFVELLDELNEVL